MQACSVADGVAVLVGGRGAVLLERDGALRTVWLAPPPRLGRSRLVRGLWLQRQALAWSAAVRAGRHAPNVRDRRRALASLAWEGGATLGVGSVLWLALGPSGPWSWVLAVAVAALRAALGRGNSARRQWHGLEHAALDQHARSSQHSDAVGLALRRRSACGRATMLAATVAALCTTWAALWLGASSLGAAVADLVGLAIGGAAAQAGRQRPVPCAALANGSPHRNTALAARRDALSALLGHLDPRGAERR